MPPETHLDFGGRGYVNIEPSAQKETKVAYKDLEKRRETRAAWRKKNADKIKGQQQRYALTERGKEALSKANALARARRQEYNASPEGQAAKLAWQMQLAAWDETRAERARVRKRRQKARKRERDIESGAFVPRVPLTPEERKERKAAARRNRRARERNAKGQLSRGIRKALYAAQRGCCPVCKDALAMDGAQKCHIDHVVPLAAGGTHTDDNVQLLCPDCNVSKGAKDPIEFMQSRGFLL